MTGNGPFCMCPLGFLPWPCQHLVGPRGQGPFPEERHLPPPGPPSLHHVLYTVQQPFPWGGAERLAVHSEVQGLWPH